MCCKFCFLRINIQFLSHSTMVSKHWFRTAVATSRLVEMDKQRWLFISLSILGGSFSAAVPKLAYKQETSSKLGKQPNRTERNLDWSRSAKMTCRRSPAAKHGHLPLTHAQSIPIQIKYLKGDVSLDGPQLLLNCLQNMGDTSL